MMGDIMARDKLYLIEPGFSDAERPGQRFVCPSCNRVEGLLRSFPELAAQLDVERVAFPRPRRQVIAEIGEDNQSLPVLILSSDAPADLPVANGKRFASDIERILALLSDRHGFPQQH